MPLTGAQLAALKADIAANTATIDFGGPTPINELPNTGDANFEIAKWYNQTAASAFTVWRTSVQVAEVMLNGFNWTRVDNLSVGKARIWEWMTKANPAGTFDPSKANIRAGIDAVWVGTQADLDVRAAVYVHCKRLATYAQKLFSTGTGSDADPATPDAGILETFKLTAADVTEARNLP